jgi:DNA polymerase III subunit gamma/tau
MTYEVLARKWRPQQLGDVVGQDHVTQTLRNAIAAGRVAHAYLFVGPRGVGKTSIARILAKALNCEKGPAAEPCDACGSCHEIMTGVSLDVMEIDAASNTGVDNVRELRENARYAPARSRNKVYIIDEVHMLSMGAFNALLKTLEEPPAHVKFLLATTEVQKIPGTILSRCQRFDLRRISTREIVGQLSKIAASEKIGIDEDALLAIARGAEGGLRDAESALDQLVAFRGRKIAEADVLSVFGLVSRRTLEGLASAVLTGDMPTLLRIVDEMDAAGKDLQRLALELLEYFKTLLVIRYAPAAALGGDVPESWQATLREQAERSDPGRLSRMVDVLLEAQGELRYALSRRTVLEIALLRAARAASLVTIDEILDQIQKLKESIGAPDEGGEDPPPPPAPAAEKRAGGEIRRPPEPSAPAAAEPPKATDDLTMLTSQWGQIIEGVATYASMAKSYLVDGKPLEVHPDRVVIGFDPEFAANREKLSVSRSVKGVQKVLGDFLKRPVSVEFVVIGQAAPPGGSGAGPGEKPAPAPAEKPSDKGPRRSRQQWLDDPAVKRALETFDGDIVDVHE